MKCPHCNWETPEGKKCNICGKKLQQSTSQGKLLDIKIVIPVYIVTIIVTVFISSLVFGKKESVSGQVAKSNDNVSQSESGRSQDDDKDNSKSDESKNSSDFQETASKKEFNDIYFDYNGDFKYSDNGNIEIVLDELVMIQVSCTPTEISEDLLSKEFYKEAMERVTDAFGSKYTSSMEETEIGATEGYRSAYIFNLDDYSMLGSTVIFYHNENFYMVHYFINSEIEDSELYTYKYVSFLKSIELKGENI